MDAQGNIRPLSEFPPEERDEAMRRLKQAEEEHHRRLESLLTSEALEDLETRIDKKIFGGES